MKPITLEAEQLAELLHCIKRINTILGFDTQVLLPSPVNYSSKSKSELADLAGTTTRTFSKWLQPFRSELRQMGVTDRTKLLPPQAVRFICEQLNIDLHPEQVNDRVNGNKTNLLKETARNGTNHLKKVLPLHRI